jgi:hypothetical protein
LFFAFITLLTALVISSVAIFYSVSGLAAIFAASATPIIIMGASLEVGKLVTAVWLHKNWKTAPSLLKAYFMAATLVLMLITSMGIFGFLSRAHIEQAAPLGDIAAQVDMIDMKIQAKKDEMSSAQTAMKNMDDVVAQFLVKGKDEKSVSSANKARTSQKKERDTLQKQVDQIQKDIAKLNEEKFPYTQKIRKAEAEVGPIKYIAQFVYGPDAGKDLFERAVTWMILTIIFVFDPLAVLLLIASQIGFEQAAHARKKKKEEPELIKETIIPPKVPVVKKTKEVKVSEPVVEEPTVDPVIEETVEEPVATVEINDEPIDNTIISDFLPVEEPTEEPVVESTPVKKKETYVMRDGNKQKRIEKK